MVANQKVTGRAMAMPAGVGIGLGLSAMITGLGCLTVAALINGERVGIEMIGYGAMIILFLAAFLGSVLAVAMIRRRRLIVSLILGTAYYICLLLINGMFFGGSVTGAGVTALVILAGSLCAGLLPSQGKGSAGTRHKKWRTG